VFVINPQLDRAVVAVCYQYWMMWCVVCYQGLHTDHICGAVF